MRLVKMFGLAMLAVVAAMAFVGAGSASAQLGSILCHLGAGTQGHCPAGSLPFTGALLALKGNLSLGISKFLSSLPIECQTEVHGTVTSAGGLTTNPLGLINSVLFESCTSASCPHGFTAVGHNLPWHLELLGSSTLNLGELHIKSHGFGNPGLLFTCHTLVFGFPTLITCGYSATSVLGEIHGETATTFPKLLVEEEELVKVHGGGLCPDDATWDYLPYLDPLTLTIHLL